ncbi:MAG: DUF1257 domain-containing protein [Synechococcaceae cyanobacterium]|jgi:hypothetical protein
MSHFSILPTVLRDAQVLAACLRSLGLSPLLNQRLEGFAGESVQVDVALNLEPDLGIGWRLGSDGRLALIGDLQRLSRQPGLQALLGKVTRAYAAHQALADAASQLPQAEIHLSA